VTLNTDWTLLNASGGQVFTRTETITVNGDTSYGQISAGMSTAVGVLADRIAAVLAKCPG